MSGDRPADSVETGLAEANAVPNGKGHEEEMSLSGNTPSADAGEKGNIPNTAQNDRTEIMEANLPEGQEFLSGTEDKKNPHFTDFEGKTSFGMSVFNLGNAIMGSGILGLAYAMANTGVVLFLVLLTVVAVLSSYSIHILLKLSGIVGIRAYEQLGYRAFGTPGKMAAGIAITLQNIGAMSSYLYIVKYEFPLVIQAFLKLDKPAGEWYMNGNYLVIIVSIAVILPLTAYTIPILAFAFVCHPEVLPIYTELRNPTKKKMQHVANISIAVMYCMYFLAALFGYLTFYGEVEAELLHTYSRIDPYDTLILCVRVAVLIAVTLTVPIVLFPVRRAIQQMIFPNKTFNWPRHIAIAFVLLTFINMLVIFAPNILGIFGVIGATSAPCLIFIFPAVFYIRIVPKEEEPMTSFPKVMVSIS
uniref:Solute carrier family 38 member 3a n=1 Tax=Gasterosteus aculeatus aculeatus TaxID=481459 RepID=G3N728_GASAC